MLAGHKINPWTTFKDSNANFWYEGFEERTTALEPYIKSNRQEKQQYTDQFPTSVEYYGKYHK